MANDPSEAWREAAADLGVDVTAPFALADPVAGTFECIALVRDFGSEQGTVVIGIGPANVHVARLAAEAGVFCSAINESAYASYDRSLFVATLNDWGWRGDAARKPHWYSGEPWS
jgi:hypothetical protein